MRGRLDRVKLISIQMQKLLYHQNDFPIFQNRMYETAIEARNCPKGDIWLVEDMQTGLVYNAAFRPDLMAYDSHYQNEQAVSLLFQQHLETVAGLIDVHIGPEQLVEVGCGKGFFLEMLLARDIDITGFDPTYEGNNERIQRKYFARGVVAQANGLILRHVLEHIQHPVNFLNKLKEANGGRGKIYIEVPCLDWILDRKSWFDIFYEHVNYFRLSDFSRIFDDVIDCGRLFGGQYLYVIAELSTLKNPEINMQDRVNFSADFTQNIIEQNRTEEGRTAIWGGASKGVIFSLLKARVGQSVSMVIDINPAKQGKYLAGTGLQVQSPKQAIRLLAPGSTIYVMNSNYIEEIRQLTKNIFNLIGIDHE